MEKPDDAPMPDDFSKGMNVVSLREMERLAWVGWILNDLDIDIAAIKRELNCYVTLKPRRRRSHGAKFRGYEACSFCGRPGSEAGQLVAGPGVWICASCVNLAVDVINASA